MLRPPQDVKSSPGNRKIAKKNDQYPSSFPNSSLYSGSWFSSSPESIQSGHLESHVPTPKDLYCHRYYPVQDLLHSRNDKQSGRDYAQKSSTMGDVRPSVQQKESHRPSSPNDCHRLVHQEATTVGTATSSARRHYSENVSIPRNVIYTRTQKTGEKPPLAESSSSGSSSSTSVPSAPSTGDLYQSIGKYNLPHDHDRSEDLSHRIKTLYYSLKDKHYDVKQREEEIRNLRQQVQCLRQEFARAKPQQQQQQRTKKSSPKYEENYPHSLSSSSFSSSTKREEVLDVVKEERKRDNQDVPLEDVDSGRLSKREEQYWKSKEGGKRSRRKHDVDPSHTPLSHSRKRIGKESDENIFLSPDRCFPHRMRDEFTARIGKVQEYNHSRRFTEHNRRLSYSPVSLREERTKKIQEPLNVVKNEDKKEWGSLGECTTRRESKSRSERAFKLFNREVREEEEEDEIFSKQLLRYADSDRLANQREETWSGRRTSACTNHSHTPRMKRGTPQEHLDTSFSSLDGAYMEDSKSKTTKQKKKKQMRSGCSIGHHTQGTAAAIHSKEVTCEAQEASSNGKDVHETRQMGQGGPHSCSPSNEASLLRRVRQLEVEKRNLEEESSLWKQSFQQAFHFFSAHSLRLKSNAEKLLWPVIPHHTKGSNSGSSSSFTLDTVFLPGNPLKKENRMPSPRWIGRRKKSSKSKSFSPGIPGISGRSIGAIPSEGDGGIEGATSGYTPCTGVESGVCGGGVTTVQETKNIWLSGKWISLIPQEGWYSSSPSPSHFRTIASLSPSPERSGQGNRHAPNNNNNHMNTSTSCGAMGSIHDKNEEGVNDVIRLRDAQRDYWIPLDVFKISQDFRNRFCPGAPVVDFYAFMQSLNMVWRKRVDVKLGVEKKKLGEQNRQKMEKALRREKEALAHFARKIAQQQQNEEEESTGWKENRKELQHTEELLSKSYADPHSSHFYALSSSAPYVQTTSSSVSPLALPASELPISSLCPSSVVGTDRQRAVRQRGGALASLRYPRYHCVPSPMSQEHEREGAQGHTTRRGLRSTHHYSRDTSGRGTEVFSNTRRPTSSTSSSNSTSTSGPSQKRSHSTHFSPRREGRERCVDNKRKTFLKEAEKRLRVLHTHLHRKTKSSVSGELLCQLHELASMLFHELRSTSSCWRSIPLPSSSSGSSSSVSSSRSKDIKKKTENDVHKITTLHRVRSTDFGSRDGSSRRGRKGPQARVAKKRALQYPEMRSSSHSSTGTPSSSSSLEEHSRILSQCVPYRRGLRPSRSSCDYFHSPLKWKRRHSGKKVKSSDSSPPSTYHSHHAHKGKNMMRMGRREEEDEDNDIDNALIKKSSVFFHSSREKKHSSRPDKKGYSSSAINSSRSREQSPSKYAHLPLQGDGEDDTSDSCRIDNGEKNGSFVHEVTKSDSSSHPSRYRMESNDENIHDHENFSKKYRRKISREEEETMQWKKEESIASSPSLMVSSPSSSSSVPDNSAHTPSLAMNPSLERLLCVVQHSCEQVQAWSTHLEHATSAATRDLFRFLTPIREVLIENIGETPSPTKEKMANEKDEHLIGQREGMGKIAEDIQVSSTTGKPPSTPSSSPTTILPTNNDSCLLSRDLPVVRTSLSPLSLNACPEVLLRVIESVLDFSEELLENIHKVSHEIHALTNTAMSEAESSMKTV